MSESNILAKDTMPVHEWPGAYPFRPKNVGRNIYQGVAYQGEGNWASATGTPGSIGYITLDGTLQTLSWRMPVQHRPVRLMLYHEDAAGNPSAANLNVDYDFKDKGFDDQWIDVAAGVMATATGAYLLGETYELPDGMYRLQLQGTATHIVYVSPYYQYLQERQARSRQGGGWIK